MRSTKTSGLAVGGSGSGKTIRGRRLGRRAGRMTLSVPKPASGVATTSMSSVTVPAPWLLDTPIRSTITSWGPVCSHKDRDAKRGIGNRIPWLVNPYHRELGQGLDAREIESGKGRYSRKIFSG